MHYDQLRRPAGKGGGVVGMAPPIVANRSQRHDRRSRRIFRVLVTLQSSRPDEPYRVPVRAPVMECRTGGSAGERSVRVPPLSCRLRRTLSQSGGALPLAPSMDL